LDRRSKKSAQQLYGGVWLQDEPMRRHFELPFEGLESSFRRVPSELLQKQLASLGLERLPRVETALGLPKLSHQFVDDRARELQSAPVPALRIVAGARRNPVEQELHAGRRWQRRTKVAEQFVTPHRFELIPIRIGHERGGQGPSLDRGEDPGIF